MPHSQKIITNNSLHFQHVLKKILLFTCSPHTDAAFNDPNGETLSDFFVRNFKMCPVLQQLAELAIAP